jgi:hypothetical protein
MSYWPPLPPVTPAEPDEEGPLPGFTLLQQASWEPITDTCQPQELVPPLDSMDEVRQQLFPLDQLAPTTAAQQRVRQGPMAVALGTVVGAAAALRLTGTMHTGDHHRFVEEAARHVAIQHNFAAAHIPPLAPVLPFRNNGRPRTISLVDIKRLLILLNPQSRLMGMGISRNAILTASSAMEGWHNTRAVDGPALADALDPLQFALSPTCSAPLPQLVLVLPPSLDTVPTLLHNALMLAEYGVAVLLDSCDLMLEEPSFVPAYLAQHEGRVFVVTAAGGIGNVWLVVTKGHFLTKDNRQLSSGQRQLFRAGIAATYGPPPSFRGSRQQRLVRKAGGVSKDLESWVTRAEHVIGRLMVTMCDPSASEWHHPGFSNGWFPS